MCVISFILLGENATCDLLELKTTVTHLHTIWFFCFYFPVLVIQWWHWDLVSKVMSAIDWDFENRERSRKKMIFICSCFSRHYHKKCWQIHWILFLIKVKVRIHKEEFVIEIILKSFKAMNMILPSLAWKHKLPSAACSMKAFDFFQIYTKWLLK